MSYTKHCTQCTMLFIDTSNNQKRFCDRCMLERRKANWERHALKLKAKANTPDPNKIQCLICLKYYKKPMAHAWQAHGTTAREYKDNYNLEQKGLILEHDKEILRRHVKDNFDLVVKRNLINNPKSQNKRFKPNHKINYTRKPATLARLRLHGKVALQKHQAKNK